MSWRRRARRTSREDAWLEAATSDAQVLLSDHAHCEKKAASTALMFIARYPEHARLVTAMAELAQEELAHFAEVHAAIVARGWDFLPDAGDPYAQALVKQVAGTPRERLVDRLLVSALIEARSCQRLRLLGKHHPDPGLAEMFARFATAEAHHGLLFEDLARELGEDPDAVDARLESLHQFEVELMERLPVRCAIH